MRKTVIFTVIIMAMATSTSAQISNVDITNVFPDTDRTDRDTKVVVRLEADSTTDADMELWITDPSNETFRASSQMFSQVKNSQARVETMQVDKEVINQDGEYTFKVNETVSGLSDSIDVGILPESDNIGNKSVSEYAGIMFAILVVVLIALYW